MLQLLAYFIISIITFTKSERSNNIQTAKISIKYILYLIKRLHSISFVPISLLL